MRKLISILAICLSLSACASQTLKESETDFNNANYDKTMAKLLPLAQNGNAKAQYVIGYMYYYGKGVPVDKVVGESWIQKAADQGQPQAIAAEKVIAKQATLNPLAK